MLDLDAPTRRIALASGATLDLAVDSDDPLTFYVQAGAPRVARTNGAPRVQLLRFVTDGKLTGGHLDLQVELAAPSGDMLEEARALLQAERTGDRKPVRIVPIPVTGGEAELMFVGTEAKADGTTTAPHARMYQKVTTAFEPPFTATFSALLDAAQATLVDAALRSGGAPIGVVVRLTVEGLLPAQRIVAHVDWRTVYTHFSSDIKEGYFIATDDVQKLAETLIQQQVIRIDVIQAVAPEGTEAQPPPDPTAQLAWVEREIVETCCKPVMPLDRDPAKASLGKFGDMFGIGEGFVLKDIKEVELDSATIDLQTRRVAIRTYTASAYLNDLLGDAPPDEHIADALTNSPFFERATLHVSTARPLAETFVSEVVAHFRYGKTDVPIHLTQDGAADGSADAWADQQADHTWSLPLDITLAKNSPIDPGKLITLPALKGQTRELTLDLEHLLGLYSVEVLASPDPRVLATRVDFALHRADADVGTPGATSGIIVNAAAPKAMAWFRDVRRGDQVFATVTHMIAGGRIVKLEPVPVETRQFRLPPAFPGTMTVQLYADDDWTGLDYLLVSLQKSPTSPAGAIKLDHGGASASASLDLPDPLDRSFRYRVERFFTNGDTQADDWMQSDHAALLVGRVAANMLVVDVTPQGLELPDAGINMIEVALEYVDAKNQLRSTPSAEIHALADVYHWTVALKDPTLRSYRYRITIHRITGATEVGPWTTSSDHILLVSVAKS